jgi:hypothetical protein
VAQALNLGLQPRSDAILGMAATRLDGIETDTQVIYSILKAVRVAAFVFVAAAQTPTGFERGLMFL